MILRFFSYECFYKKILFVNMVFFLTFNHCYSMDNTQIKRKINPIIYCGTNSCYLNSVLQCITNFGDLTESLLNNKDKNLMKELKDFYQCNDNFTVVFLYQQILRKIKECKENDCKKIVEDCVIYENSTSENLNKTLYNFYEKIAGIGFGNMSDPTTAFETISGHFQFVYKRNSFIKDLLKIECKIIKTDILNSTDQSVIQNVFFKSITFNENLQNSLDLFVKEQTVSIKGKEYKKQIEFLKLPKILSINLSTVVLNAEITSRPFSLEIVFQNKKYSLISFIMFRVNHYTAYAKDYESGIWGYFNDLEKASIEVADEEIKEIVKNGKNSNSFYPKMLFYKQKEDEENVVVENKPIIETILQKLKKQLVKYKIKMFLLSKKLSQFIKKQKD